MRNNNGINWDVAVIDGKLVLTMGTGTYEFKRDEAVLLYLELSEALRLLKRKVRV